MWNSYVLQFVEGEDRVMVWEKEVWETRRAVADPTERVEEVYTPHELPHQITRAQAKEAQAIAHNIAD